DGESADIERAGIVNVADYRPESIQEAAFVIEHAADRHGSEFKERVATGHDGVIAAHGHGTGNGHATANHEGRGLDRTADHDVGLVHDDSASLNVTGGFNQQLAGSVERDRGSGVQDEGAAAASGQRGVADKVIGRVAPDRGKCGHVDCPAQVCDQVEP